MNIFRQQLTNKQAELADLQDRMEALSVNANADGTLEEADQKIFDQTYREIQDCQKEIARLDKNMKAYDSIQASRANPGPAPQQQQTPASEITQNGTALVLNNMPKLYGKKSRFFEDVEDAVIVGHWVAANFLGKKASQDFIDNNAHVFENAQEIGSDPLGGYTVPQPLSATLIRLLLTYGVFPQYARTWPMSSATLDIPTQEGGTQVFYPGEAGSIDPSDITFGQVNLIAVKYAQMNLMSTEVLEDSLVDLADLVVDTMARQYAQAIDANSFLGDGTGAFGGITGIKNALNAGSQVVASGTNLAAITMADFNEMVGRLPMYEGVRPTWFMSHYFYYAVIWPLLVDLGGTNIRQVEEGGRLMFMGYPIQWTNVLPGKNAVANDLVCVFGDLFLGAAYGIRRQVNFKTLNELYAATDQVAIQSTLRSDSVIHSQGDATEAGSIVGLYLAAALAAGEGGQKVGTIKQTRGKEKTRITSKAKKKD